MLFMLLVFQVYSGDVLMAKAEIIFTVWDEWVHITPEINYIGCVLCCVGNKLWLVQANL